ncbi:MAG: polyketide cyclase [Candidatus Omnitrophica bacterium]|nr:polyketide cyclase [Candidatus Omnitrophota bacterium]
MSHTRNEITISAPYELVFDISNRIERWTELFGKEYAKAEVLERKGNEITFRLTDEDGKSWVSKRWLDKEHRYAVASRHEPMFPFIYMKIVWLYIDTPEGIKMVWIQDFAMDPKFTKFTAEQIEGFINEHSRHNMKIFKEVIEKEAGSVPTPR